MPGRNGRGSPFEQSNHLKGAASVLDVRCSCSREFPNVMLSTGDLPLHEFGLCGGNFKKTGG